MTEDRPTRRAEERPRADYSGSLANHIATGENPVMLSLPALATSRVRLSVADPSARVVGGEAYLR